MSSVEHEIRRLHRQRPRSLLLRISGLALAALTALAWIVGDFSLGAFLAPRRRANLERFLGELVPHPLQGRDFDLGLAASWVGEMMATHGWAALRATAAISVAAILLATFGGLLTAFPAARNLATAEPFLPSSGRPRRAPWKLLVGLSRGLQILSRALPEYVLAFLFLALFGPSAWPAVLALALHNAGILGKLTAEVVEDLDPRVPAALRGLGAGRTQIAQAAVVPLVLNRILLFVFYRWETCVREATVLGLLGIVSLGYWIQDARARNHYDEMFFYVLLGAILVVVGDIVSTWARGRIREAE
ncbi:MAG: ABC transporter permease subunit [Acidobacteriota bacterium]